MVSQLAFKLDIEKQYKEGTGPAQAQQQFSQSAGDPPVPGAGSTLPKSQVDGAGDGSRPFGLSDWKAEVARRREAAERDGGTSDHLIRRYVASQGLALEANGLMRSLHEALRDSRSSRAVRNRPDTAAPSSLAQSSQPASDSRQDHLAPSTDSAAMLAPSRYDGADDVDDEDAINSDLDDPDDLLDEEDADGDAIGQVMLCTYDKVQRVKNKWKCTLKDGVLSCGGKEYVFHKGNGEFEW
ncbi:transcription factor IIA subunit alpha [Ascosphaera acerosa]|nr:transcription factor IIA subunit alpha [Ascosphaera acerosa]